MMIVQRIKTALDREDSVSANLMAPLASEYAEQVRAVNDRLARVVALLNRGLRTEALQLAQHRPDLLESAASLDFPELEEWIDVIQFLEVPAPPALDRAAIAQLNEAINEALPLESLLKRHRLLAIVRAPLPWRIRVLQRIVEADPLNPIWREDLETWEKARIKQLDIEAARALREDDQEAIPVLYNELVSTNWDTQVPSTLLDQVTSAFHKIENQRQLSDLTSLADKLNDAFASMDDDLARELRSQWLAIAGAIRAPLPSDLSERVAPALEWLRNLDEDTARKEEHLLRIGRLSNALDQEAPTNDLRRFFHAAAASGEQIPQELVKHYELTIRQREITAKRKLQGIVVATLACTCIVIVAFFFYQSNARYQNQVVQTLNELQSLIDNGNLKAAESFINTLQSQSPGLFAEPPIGKLVSDVYALRQQESDRETQFQAYIAQADSSSPEEIDLSALVKAEQLAKSEIEKGRAYSIRRRRDLWDQQVQQQHSKAVMDRLKILQERLDAIEKEGVPDEQLIESLINEGKQVVADHPRRSSATADQVQLFEQRALVMRTAMAARMRRQQERDNFLTQIARAKTLDEYKANLTTFAANFPQDSATQEVKAAIEELPAWQQLNDWNRNLTLLRNSLASNGKGSNYTDTLAKFSSLEAAIVFPREDGFSEAYKVVQFIQRLLNRQRILEELATELRTGVMGGLHTCRGTSVDTEESVRYFVKPSSLTQQQLDAFPRATKANVISVRVVVSNDGGTGNRSLRGPIEYSQEPRVSYQEIAAALSTSRDKFLNSWDSEFLRLIGNVRAKPDLDTVAKLHLIQKLFDTLVQETYLDPPGLQTIQTVITQEIQDQVDWYAVQPPNQLLPEPFEASALPVLKNLFQNTSTAEDVFGTLPVYHYDWIGFLYRAGNGTVMGRLREASDSRDGPVFVARTTAGRRELPELVHVGRISGKTIVLDQDTSDATFGRPLFLRRPVALENTLDSISK